jgi:hypothetical protein
MSTDKCYYDLKINDTTRYRLFDKGTDERELLWHQDERDREICVMEGGGWSFQFDDQLPITLENGMVIQITNHRYHRIIKGKGDLIIKIKE